MSDADAGITPDPLASMMERANRLVEEWSQRIAEVEQIKQDLLKAKVEAEAERKAAGEAREGAVDARVKAEAQATQLTNIIQAANEAQRAAEADRLKAGQASTDATSFETDAEASAEKANQANSAIAVIRESLAGEQTKAEKANAAAAAANEAANGEAQKARQAADAAKAANDAAEAERNHAAQFAKAAEIAKTTAEGELSATIQHKQSAIQENDLASKARATAEEERERARKAAGEATAAKTDSEKTKGTIAQLEKDVRTLKQAAEKANSETATAAQEAKVATDRALAQAKAAADAHNLSTATGLAAAFSEKSGKTRFREWIWSGILVASLAGALTMGILRYESIMLLLKDRPDLPTLVGSILVAIFGVGGPIWLAWVATGMISKTFALNEDYAYKAALARAYVGFRAEAKALDDPILEQRLFAAAITQLDANPVRLLNSSHPGSPLQDLLQQPFMQKIMEDTEFKNLLADWFKRTFGGKEKLPVRAIEALLDVKAAAAKADAPALPPTGQ